MPTLIACARCGRRVSSEAAKRVAGEVLCPPCVPERRREAEEAFTAEQKRPPEVKAAPTAHQLHPIALPFRFVWLVAGIVGLGCGMIIGVAFSGGKNPSPERQPDTATPTVYRYITLNGQRVDFPDLAGDDIERPRRAWVPGAEISIQVATVFQILGPRSMLMQDLPYTLDEGFAALFHGWPTAGLYDGQRWFPNPKPVTVIVVGTYQYATAGNYVRTVPVVMPAEMVREGLTREQFLALSN